MLAFLLDEQISHEVASQLATKYPEITVASVHDWEGGHFRGAKDEPLLLAAAAAGVTLVTYDQSTIPSLLIRLAEAGVTHAGVIFVDERTIPSHDFGGVPRALVYLWKESGTWDWSNRVVFLRPVP